MAIPATGPAWDEMYDAAHSTWGAPTIADQNSNDDTDTLAGALVAVRTEDPVLANKVTQHLLALAQSHPYDRVLALARELPSYVIASDIIDLPEA